MRGVPLGSMVITDFDMDGKFWRQRVVPREYNGPVRRLSPRGAEALALEEREKRRVSAKVHEADRARRRW
jgi:hypothetical protein